MELSNTKLDSEIRGSALRALFSFKSAYSRFALLLLLISVITVIPMYSRALETPGIVPLQALLHAGLFLGWYILFSIQAGLVSANNQVLHKTLGYCSLVVAFILMASGIGMLVNAMMSFDPNWSAQILRSRISLTWGVFHTIVCFMVFYSLGFYF